MGKTLTHKLVTALLVTSMTVGEVSPIALSVQAISEQSLPNGFVNHSIGDTSGLGSAYYDQLLKQFNITGSGTTIGKDPGTTDNYQFVSYEVQGDATIVARLVDFDMTNAPYGQAGVFMRSDNQAEDSDYMGVYVEPSKNQYRYAYRDTTLNKTGAAAISN